MNDTLIIVICIFLMSVLWSFYFKIKEGIENVDNYVMPISFSNNKSTNPSRDESKTINVPEQITSNGNLNLMKNTNIEGALNVKSNVDVNSGLLVKGNTTTNELKVNGNTNTNGLSVNGNTTTNELKVNGNTTTNGLSVNGNTTTNTLNVPGKIDTKKININGTSNINGIQCGKRDRGLGANSRVNFPSRFANNNVFVFTNPGEGEWTEQTTIKIVSVDSGGFDFQQRSGRQYREGGNRYIRGIQSYDLAQSDYSFTWVAFCI